MGHEEQVRRFLQRKAVKHILGEGFQLSNKQHDRLCRLLDVYKTPKNMENMLSTVANFINYDLSNYTGRYRRLLGVNGTSKYTQMLRYGRFWESIYKNQTNKKIKHFKNTSSYWIGRGCSQDEAHQKVKEVQTMRGMEAAKKLRGTSCYTVRSVKYWINNGYSLDQATEKVRAIQTTNGIDYYKKIYPDDYEDRYKARIEQWQESFNKNDLQLINLKRSPTIEGALARGLTYEEAVEYRNNNIKHMRQIRRLPSKISQKMCQMIDDRINGMCYYSCKNYEKLISGYRVDFYHCDSRTVVEFYGDFYHRNPNLFEETHVAFNMTAKEKWQYDEQREEAIRQSSKVERLITVWESDFRQNPTGVVNRIIKEML